MKNYLVPEQLAEELGIEIKTVYRMLNRGEIKAMKVGRQWRIPLTALDEMLDEQMRERHATMLER